ITSTRLVLPVPAGITTEPRTIWSAYFGLTPSRTETSTVSSHLSEILVLVRTAHASLTEYFLRGSYAAIALRYFLPAMGSSCGAWSGALEDESSQVVPS